MKRISLTIALIVSTLSSVSGQTKEDNDSTTIETLQEVIVTAPSTTKLVGTTLVTTIAGTGLQNLGTCLDVLSQLPLISVKDGSVEVTGKGSPEIYIDGRPMRDGEELKRLQSATLRKVELLMAPGAMYSSETRAVLKIYTKRNLIDGLSLTERVEVTARRRWSANDLLDLNYRFGHWDIFMSGTVARNNSLIKGKTTNILEYKGEKTEIGSSQHNTYPSTNGTLKGGFNYSDDSMSFGGYYRFNPERGDYTNTGSEWINSAPPILRNIYRSIQGRSHYASIYFDDTFSEGYSLHFDGDFRKACSDESILTSFPSAEWHDVTSKSHRNSKLLAGKLYLTAPLWGGETVFGTQASHTHTALDYRMLNEEVSQYIPSSLTDARQTSAALFASWNRYFGKLALTAGLRYEYVDYEFDVNGEKDVEVSRKHNLFTPDVSLSWNFNEQTQVAMSYRLSTIRPPYSQLTGSLGYVGRHEIEGGNPALKDERMHDIQLFGMWKDFMFQGDFTRSLDSYAFVKRIYPADDLQLLLQPININVSAVDMYLVWTKTIRSWTPNVTLGMHRQWLEIEGRKYDRPIFSYFFENLLALPRGWTVTLNAYGQTKGELQTNCFGTTFCSVDASVSKSFLDKSLQLKMTATDIFDSANNDWTMHTFGVFMDKRQTYDRRGVSLSIIYRLNPRQSKFKGSSAAEEEMKRL